tara:strand:- start:9816 stop:10484 length:669 start_codon:yes stop_codon:yes gene_type:complete
VRVISFSLWGNNPKYTVGAIKNAELAKEIYPGWICRFYCANDVPNPIIFQLEGMDNVEVIIVDEVGSWKFTTQRFLAIDDPEAKIIIFRDTDSRLNSREQEAVTKWLQSNKSLHIMKDHPYHGGFPILAGMWGLKTTEIKVSMASLLEKYNNAEQYHYDQIFLKNWLWPLYAQDFIAHDEFFLKKPFPTKREGLNYVGKPFDADDLICLPGADEALRRIGIR